MSDTLLKSYSLILGIKQNIPDNHEVKETWVKEFHAALDRVQKEVNLDLSEFFVPDTAIHKSLSGFSYMTKEKRFKKGLWCEKKLLLQKVDAVLNYFQLLLQPQEKKIGFNQ